jgi:hypothetical protein
MCCTNFNKIGCGPMSGGGFNRFFGVPFYANAYQTLNGARFF